VRVHTAERHVHGAPPSEEVWLLIEWPEDQKVPTKYSLCSLPADTPLWKLVYLAKLRWKVERDYHPEQDSLDSGPSAAPPSAPAAATHRPLPALPAPHQLPSATSGAIAHVIREY
jgi:hypothetical protein